MRGVGQQRFVGLDQGFNARRGRIELARQVGHLVLPVLGNAHRQIAFAKPLHAALQGLQPLQQATDDGEHPHGHGQAHQAQHPQETKGRTHPEGGFGASVGAGVVAPVGARSELQVVGGAVGAVDAQLQAFARWPRHARG